jgi:S-formylglutathione hydrolase
MVLYIHAILVPTPFRRVTHPFGWREGRFFPSIPVRYNADMSGAWNRVTINEKPADVFEPTQARPHFGVLFLHDQDGRTLREDATYTQLLDAAYLACVCPAGDQAWWSDHISPSFDPHITAERYVLDKVVPYFRERWGIEPRGIGLLGVGMGGQGALRLAFKHPQTFLAVAGIASALDCHELYGEGTPLDAMYDSKEQCRQDTAILHLHPTHYPPHIFYAIDSEDPWYRGNDRLHEKMNALGVPHELCLTAEGAGERAMRFIVTALETESRRLL